MMTIAKLDSNGIMVIPEKGADSLVDSSTGPPIDSLSRPSTSGTGQPTPPSQGNKLEYCDKNERCSNIVCFIAQYLLSKNIKYYG